VWLVQPLRSKSRPIRQPLRAGSSLAYERLSDPILVKRAKDGDRQALEALCARHQPAVEKIARRILRDPEDARDATQESLAKVCTRIRQFRGESQFATWLHRLVVNTCRDALARRRSWEELPDDLTAAPAGDVGDRDELRACLLELPPAQARVVVLKDALGYSFEEISAASGMPVGTAKCYAHRARNSLRERLEERVA
jgi:RNA polymerase sigma-70 factor (ECF subfamily)